MECNKNHIGRDTLLDSSMKLPRCLTQSTAIFEQTLKITSPPFADMMVSWKEVRRTKRIISALKAPSLMLLLKKSLDLSCGYPCWLLNEGSRSLTRSLLPFLVSTSVTNSPCEVPFHFLFFFCLFFLLASQMKIGQLVTFCFALLIFKMQDEYYNWNVSILNSLNAIYHIEPMIF